MDALGTLPLLAGTVSTAVFAGSVLPMVVKAVRTRDLASYSLGNLVLANVGNAIHSVYVLSLPPGPIWVLHGFYVVTSLLMLGGYLRYAPAEADAQAEQQRPEQEPPGVQSVRPVVGSGRGVQSVRPVAAFDRAHALHGVARRGADAG